MNILMLAPQCFLTPRGTPLSVLQRVRALSVQGHQIDLITYPFGEDTPVGGLTIHRIRKLPGLREIKVGPSWQKPLLDFLLFLKALSCLRRKRYDLIHSHEEGAFFGCWLSRMFRVPHVYDMHSSLPQQLSNFGFCSFAPVVKLLGWLEREAICHSDAVIAVYPELRDHVQTLAPGKRVFLIENVDDIGKAEEARSTADLRAAHGIDGRRAVVYTGSFEPYQGLDLLIESARLVVDRVKDVMFVCVGGNERQRESLRRIIRSRGLEPYFLLPGTLPIEQMPGYLQLADVLVSPRTKGNNTPLKIYSYLRAGKAIVATDLTTHLQVLNPEVALLVEPTPEAFAEGIVTALRDPELRRRLGQKAAALAAEKYAYAAFIAKTQEALEYFAPAAAYEAGAELGG
ncbi:MAG TPA: glycosyltransferase family 4 protein [Candidatus Eisenbacteria bacterium]|nr:glycosyltransferase family 4 protein [Candidatus Eisenbacteria bacterium]